MPNSCLAPDEIAAVRAPIERASTLPPHVEPYRLADPRSTPRLDYDCPWNWKVSVENGSESSHHLGQFRNWLLDQIEDAA